MNWEIIIMDNLKTWSEHKIKLLKRVHHQGDHDKFCSVSQAEPAVRNINGKMEQVSGQLWFNSLNKSVIILEVIASTVLLINYHHSRSNCFIMLLINSAITLEVTAHTVLLINNAITLEVISSTVLLINSTIILEVIALTVLFIEFSLLRNWRNI